MNTNILTSILKSSSELITSESFRAKHRIDNTFTRSVKLSFQNLIYSILRSTHKSLSVNYSELVDSFQFSIPTFVTKQALSKSRQGLSHEAFIELFRHSVEQFYAQVANLHT